MLERPKWPLNVEWPLDEWIYIHSNDGSFLLKKSVFHWIHMDHGIMISMKRLMVNNKGHRHHHHHNIVTEEWWWWWWYSLTTCPVSLRRWEGELSLNMSPWSCFHHHHHHHRPLRRHHHYHQYLHDRWTLLTLALMVLYI